MESVVIFNPKSGSAEDLDLLGALVARGVTRLEAEHAGDAAKLAREASTSGTDLIIAAGGDGTVNEVVNGIMESRRRPTLGIFPLGTGNDLARTLDIPVDPEAALGVIDNLQTRTIDLIEVSTGGRTLYGINASAGGFSGQVNENLTTEMKASWGPFAFLLGAATTLKDLQEYLTTIEWENGETETLNALNVIVANGRTVGGGKRVAPMANPEDGLLDVVVVRFAPIPRLAEVAARLLAGDYTNSEAVFHRRVRSLSVHSTPDMWFNLDGELITMEEISFRVMPGAINVLVGPDYRAEPPEE